MELWQLQSDVQNKLDQALSSLYRNGCDYAEAEREYQTAKSKEMFRLTDEGYSSTLINAAIKGLPEIAELNYKRMVAQVCYEANQEAINVTKLELRIIEEQIKREYSNARDD